MYAYNRKYAARALVVAFCATAIISAALPDDVSLPATVRYDAHTYPVTKVVHRQISQSDLCTMMSGTWCDGVLPKPKPDTRVVFDNRSFTTLHQI